ncbi:MAG: GNAT family N-acetyltransferase [Candidatus Bathyarchaeia archaeon]|jgi:ribosomal protein S18 acetylase RimI-like enzyme
MKVSEIRNTYDIDYNFPNGFSFFESYIQYFVKEILEIGGEVYVSRTSEGAFSGIFMYDASEKLGTIYTQSREVFDYFYELKPFNFLFAEMRSEVENEIYDIYTVDLENHAIAHRFSHEISMAEEGGRIGEIEQFMASSHPGINKRWVSVALKNGDRCFIVRLSNEIAGLGWLSFVNGIGRLHSLYVKPQFRRIGIGEDILNARLLWLKSKHARSAFCEISRYNVASSGNVMKAQMRVSGQVFQYFKKKSDRKKEMKS